MEGAVETKELESKVNLVPTSPPPVTVATGDADGESEERDRHARELKAGLHPLKLVFWYMHRTLEVRTQTSYEDNIRKIVDFNTVESYWVIYCHLAEPD